MIVAKTRMKKIPATCNKCCFSCIDRGEGRYCTITYMVCPIEKKESGNYGYSKPDWCPLVELKQEDK